MKFRDVPADAIVKVGNTLDGPYYAKKLDGMVQTGQVQHNAHLVLKDGTFQGVFVLMEDQEVEIVSTDNATTVADKPKPKRGASKRAGGGSAGGRVPATGSDSSGESVG